MYLNFILVKSFVMFFLQVVDIPNALKELRKQRMHMVQTLEQYKFVYSVLIQYIKNARLI